MSLSFWYDKVYFLLLDAGFSSELAADLQVVIGLISLLLLSFAAYFLARILARFAFRTFIHKTRTVFDDVFINKRFLRRASFVIPFIIINKFIPLIIPSHPGWIGLVHDICVIMLIMFTLYALFALSDAFHTAYMSMEKNQRKPIKGYLQIIKIILGFIASVLIVSVLINESPGFLLGGLGAMTAVLLLIFKDTILGFVASVQLSSNDMLRPGDWITVEKYKADGDVTEISLTSVKIRNFDNSIVTVPTYSMISDSFQNWRGMKESDGRRIKRAIKIDMNSVRFCNEEMLDRYRQLSLISDYVQRKEAEIQQYNQLLGNPGPDNINGRRQTNIGIFRAYLEAYLKEHKDINSDLILMVRQLPPDESGVALEIYAFSRRKEWEEYERLIADIFDHILSSIGFFDLRVFQSPGSGDFIIHKNA